MPVFNAEAYLHNAIESILNQSYKNFEFIIINDGSTDKSGSIIASYTDTRIKCLSIEANSGLVNSLNFGIDFAGGEYIARMDADDIALPQRLKIQVEFLETNPAYGMCGTFYEVIDVHGKMLNKVKLPEIDRDIKTYLNFGNCFCHSTMMFRTSFAKNYKYEEKYFLVEDYKLWRKISEVSKISILPSYTLQYRIHDNNISSMKRDKMYLQLEEMNKMILHDLSIDFSVKELIIHTNCLFFNYEIFNNHENMRELESWIIKAFLLLKNKLELNQNLIARIFLRRWFVICFKTKNYKALIFSDLFLHFK
jgi:glycosyltransferase involved in cell wall biosynthesis